MIAYIFCAWFTLSLLLAPFVAQFLESTSDSGDVDYSFDESHFTDPLTTN